MLGLDIGGSCRGVLYTIAAADIASELEIVWRREMVTARLPARLGHGAHRRPGRAGRSRS